MSHATALGSLRRRGRGRGGAWAGQTAETQGQYGKGQAARGAADERRAPVQVRWVPDGAPAAGCKRRHRERSGAPAALAWSGQRQELQRNPRTPGTASAWWGVGGRGGDRLRRRAAGKQRRPGSPWDAVVMTSSSQSPEAPDTGASATPSEHVPASTRQGRRGRAQPLPSRKPPIRCSPSAYQPPIQVMEPDPGHRLRTGVASAVRQESAWNSATCPAGSSGPGRGRETPSGWPSFRRSPQASSRTG